MLCSTCRDLTYPAGLALADGVACVVDGLVLLARVERDGVVRRVLVGARVGAAVAGPSHFGGAVEDDLKKQQRQEGEDAGNYLVVLDVDPKHRSTLMEQLLSETTV